MWSEVSRRYVSDDPDNNGVAFLMIDIVLGYVSNIVLG